jgi:hypothetical protein
MRKTYTSVSDVFENVSFFISICKLVEIGMYEIPHERQCYIRCTNTSRRRVPVIYKTERVHHTDLELIESSMQYK